LCAQQGAQLAGESPELLPGDASLFLEVLSKLPEFLKINLVYSKIVCELYVIRRIE